MKDGAVIAVAWSRGGGFELEGAWRYTSLRSRDVTGASSYAFMCRCLLGALAPYPSPTMPSRPLLSHSFSPLDDVLNAG